MLSTQENAIIIEDLKKSFKNLEVLKGVDLTVRRGNILALLGPNGAGKTTIIRILSTLLHPDNGNVFVNGFDIKTQPQEVRRSIGLTGQFADVDEYLTGLENLLMMGKLYHLSRSVITRRTEELLKKFDLTEAARRPVKTYSGGMRRKLDLAASLIAYPPIVFLDEPTSSLDPRSRLNVWETIKKLLNDGVTVLLTTQHLEEADFLADTIAVINDGRIIAEDTPGRLKSRVGKERLELVIKRQDDFERAVTVITGNDLSHNSAEKTVSLAIENGVNEIQGVLNQLAESGIEVDTLTLRKPTLDDVFMHFTGLKPDEGRNEAA